MTDETTRAILDELATLRRAVAAQERRLAARQGRRARGRFLAALAVATLAALLPFSLLAVTPFTDLDPSPSNPHNADIDLIYGAGITKGCVPGQQYCPKGNVTREEMASFLARVAGLGNNPPVVNAKTVPDGSITPAKLSAAGSTPGQTLVSTGTGVAFQTVSGGGGTAGGRLAGATSGDVTLNGTFGPVATVALPLPAVGFVLVTATHQLIGGDVNSGLDGTTELRLRNNGTGDTSPALLATVDDLNQVGNGAITYIFAVGEGAGSFSIEARVAPRDPAFAGPVTARAHITALYLP
jgi:hypothetical protein